MKSIDADGLKVLKCVIHLYFGNNLLNSKNTYFESYWILIELKCEITNGLSFKSIYTINNCL